MKQFPTVLTVVIGMALLLATFAHAKPKDPVGPKQAAKLECQAQKQADAGAFAATYGRRGMSSCADGKRLEARGEIRDSRKQCREERDESRAAFKQTYGNNRNGKNASGRCVSSKVRADRQQDRSEFKNAAQECREERGDTEESRAAFEEKYGTKKDLPLYRPQPRNAFGNCVSSKVRQNNRD